MIINVKLLFHICATILQPFVTGWFSVLHAACWFAAILLVY